MACPLEAIFVNDTVECQKRKVDDALEFNQVYKNTNKGITNPNPSATDIHFTSFTKELGVYLTQNGDSHDLNEKKLLYVFLDDLSLGLHSLRQQDIYFSSDVTERKLLKI